MRWDDIQILRRIHDLENAEAGYLLSGFSLMERIKPSPAADPIRDANLFAKELVLASEAGYIQFNDQAHGRPPSDPFTTGHYWLQEIRDIRLTLAGRDRALGRVVLVEPPDPNEDDGRNISSLTLDEVAEAIGRTYSLPQLERFLSDSGIPTEQLGRIVGSTPAERMSCLLENLHEGGSADRRLLRTFLGQWLSNRLHSWPDLETRKTVMTHLAQQGWHIAAARLVIGDQLPAPVDPLLMTGSIVATVVRTDVAGSTQMRKAVGEAVWADRRDSHYSSLRRLLEDYRGIEINDLGDGLLTWFASPREAVAFAQAAMAEAVATSLPIRIAVDSGECKILPPPTMLEGLPLARVERLAARTAPGEILLSDSVKPLLTGAAIPLQDKSVELADFGRMNAFGVVGER